MNNNKRWLLCMECKKKYIGVSKHYNTICPKCMSGAMKQIAGEFIKGVKEKKQESEKICNNCEHIESCVEELYLRDNMPDKFVCDNFKLKQEEEK